MFGAVALVSALLPAIFYLGIPDALRLPLYLLVQIVGPAILASVAMAVGSNVIWSRAYDGPAKTLGSAWRKVAPGLKEVLAASLLSGILSLTLALFLRNLAPLVLYVVFGPPVLIQVVALEQRDLQGAWGRTRSLLAGRAGRTLLYLLTVAIGVALLSAVIVSLAYSLVADTGDVTRAVALNIVNVLVLGLLFPYLNCAGFSIYDSLRAEVDTGPEVLGESTSPTG